MNSSQKVLSSAFISGLLLSVMNYLSLAQEPPLQPTGYFDRSEVIMVWDEGSTNGATIHEKNLKLKFNYQGFDLGQRFTGGDETVSDTTLSYDKRQIDLISGDFNNDNMADYLYTLTGDDDSLHLILAKRPKTLSYTSKQMYKFDGRTLPGKNLILGDLNGDGRSEFVAGYRPFDQELAHVAVFGFDNDFDIVLLDTIGTSVSINDFVIDLSDLDGDGNDELILGYFEESSSTEYFLQVYDFNPDYSYMEKARLMLDLLYNANEYGSIALTGIDYDTDGTEELVMAFNKNESDAPNNPDTYLYTAELMDDPANDDADPLEMIRFYKDSYESGRYNYGNVWQILLKSGDLNGDGKPEALLGCYSGVEIFQVNTDNQIEHLGKQSGVNGFDSDLSSINYFDVADVTGDDRDDIVTLNHYFSYGPVGDQGFSIRMFQYDSLYNSTNIESVYQYNPIDNGGGGGMHRTHYAVSLSDFDGDLFRIGDYTSQGCFTDVIRPMTVLNTPPVHIDYLNGIVHDVNECFGLNDCTSSVQKATEEFSQEEFSIETSSTGDWGFDPSYTLGIDQNLGGIGGVNMSPIELSSVFGDDLDELVVDKNTTSIGKSTSTSFFQTSSMDTRFSRDDAILTIVSDYERWEYPVYNEHDELLGEIVILIPQTTNQENWLRGRQVLGIAGMVQRHEPGNLLSYRKFYSSEKELMEANPDIKEIIAIANEHELDLNSTFTESITWGTEFENSDVSVENTVETQPSGGVNFLGFQFRAQDESVAEEEVITSHVYKVGKNLGIEVYGSSLAANSYEFKVKPYYYWSINGALVVDYMIDLSAGSFWKENYTIQDPGFLLPNRLDSLKAKNEIDKITDLDEYLMTPSIMLDPAIPVNGDTVKVTALVHNLSLSATDQKVELSFYLGDPDKGGSLISDVDGNTLFTTESVIQDQNYAMIDFDWVADFERNDRMYAVIDPDDRLVENKDDNNKAWAPVQRFAACGESPTSVQTPYQAISFKDRFRIYPNPSNGIINLEYSGPDISEVYFTITDISGKIFMQQVFNFAEMNYFSVIDISTLPQGLYIMSLSAGNYRQNTKLLVE